MSIMKKFLLMERNKIHIDSFGVGPMCQLPPNYRQGRLVCIMKAKGAGPGLSDVYQTGIAIWDWNPSKNRYDLANFKALPDTWTTEIRILYTMASNTQFLAIKHPTDPSDTKAYRAKISIGAYPSTTITYQEDFVYCGDENYPEKIDSQLVIGYNGSMIYGYDHEYSGLTENGWINKVTATAFQNMNGAVNTGLNPEVEYQARSEDFFCMLGGSNPNGYLVVNALNTDYATIMRYKIVNCNNQPVAPGQGVSFHMNMTTSVYPLSPTKVLCTDRVIDDYVVGYQKLYMFRANSAVAPTYVMQGPTCDALDVPPGVGFTLADTQGSVYSLMGSSSNTYYGDNKAFGYIHWVLKPESALANGYDSYRVMMPIKITSNSNSHLSVEYLTSDINGNTDVYITQKPGQTFDSWNLFYVSSPEGKATAIWLNSNSTQLRQQTFQL